MPTKGGGWSRILGLKKAFDLASLAKQGWRLQTCTNTLLHRVYKANISQMVTSLPLNLAIIHLLLREVYFQLRVLSSKHIGGRLEMGPQLWFKKKNGYLNHLLFESQTNWLAAQQMRR